MNQQNKQKKDLQQQKGQQVVFEDRAVYVMDDSLPVAHASDFDLADCAVIAENAVQHTKRGCGRPRLCMEGKVKRCRGRPRKITMSEPANAAASLQSILEMLQSTSNSSQAQVESILSTTHAASTSTLPFTSGTDMSSTALANPKNFSSQGPPKTTGSALAVPLAQTTAASMQQNALQLVSALLAGGSTPTKAQNPTWKRQEVNALLSICDRNRALLDDHRKLYKTIQDGMAALGFANFGIESIKNKYSSLRATYRKQKLLENSSGQGPSTWYWMNQMEEIFGNRPIVNCTEVFSIGVNKRPKLIQPISSTAISEYSIISSKNESGANDIQNETLVELEVNAEVELDNAVEPNATVSLVSGAHENIFDSPIMEQASSSNRQTDAQNNSSTLSACPQNEMTSTGLNSGSTTSSSRKRNRGRAVTLNLTPNRASEEEAVDNDAEDQENSTFNSERPKRVRYRKSRLEILKDIEENRSKMFVATLKENFEKREANEERRQREKIELMKQLFGTQ